MAMRASRLQWLAVHLWFTFGIVARCIELGCSQMTARYQQMVYFGEMAIARYRTMVSFFGVARSWALGFYTHQAR